MNKRLYLDINVLQTVPASNINRDDAGSPKTCIFGGVTRARVSSQAQKKAVRDNFRDCLPEESMGYRTKHVLDMAVGEVQRLKPEMSDTEAEKLAMEALGNAGLKLNKEKNLDALMLVSKRQVEALARLAVEGETNKKVLKKALTEGPSVDQVLFGRMVAADTSMNWDAVCQVSHAFSTHGVTTEFDYFTAVDDCSAEDTAGAGHIGVTEFNSSTLYRYANINVMELKKGLGVDTIPAINAFVESFVLTMPSGKSNSFANRTVPEAVYIVLREDQPVNLAPAFEKPVYSSENGYAARSKEALVEYVTAPNKLKPFIEDPLFEMTVGSGLESIKEPVSLKQAIQELDSAIEAHLSEEA